MVSDSRTVLYLSIDQHQRKVETDLWVVSLGSLNKFLGRAFQIFDCFFFSQLRISLLRLVRTAKSIFVRTNSVRLFQLERNGDSFTAR